MKKNLILVAMGIIMATAGCQTAPMTAKSRLVTGGEITTTTITVTNGVTNMVQVIKSLSAGDLELKEHELTGRTKVGTAQAARWNPWGSTVSTTPPAGYIQINGYHPAW